MVRIRPLLAADIAGADDVLRDAFGALVSFAPRLRRYLAIQPDGWLVAEEGGTLIGMVGAIDYQSFAYVGMMGVRPDRQGRGVGRRLLASLLDWIEGRGIPGARLDATPEGALLYQRMGFVDAGTSLELHWSGKQLPSLETPVLAVEVASQEAEIVALDHALFGADRTRLWRWLFGEQAGPVLVSRTAGGQLSGYLCVQEQTLGPWGARTPEAAAALAHAAAPLIRDPRTRVMVPAQNEIGPALLEARGWAVKKSVRHMCRGRCPDPPGWRWLYGKGSYCLG
jgi:GNAT superfamily N-acetyltransferase